LRGLSERLMTARCLKRLQLGNRWTKTTDSHGELL
jgi:hypothetical protein